MENSHSQIRLVTNALLTKKNTPISDNESIVITEILQEIGNKYPHQMIAVIRDELNSQKYSIQQKAIIYRVLGGLGRDHADIVEGYVAVLHPLLLPVLQKEGFDSTLARSGLKCWPLVHPPKCEQDIEVVTFVASLTLHSDREIASSAVVALQGYVKVLPYSNLATVLGLMANYLGCVDSMKQEDVLKVFQIIDLMLNTYVEYRNNEPKAIHMKESDWVPVRIRLEGVCLLWLCHPEAWVRDEALNLLKSCCREEFRTIEAANAQSEETVDLAYPYVDNEGKCPLLADVIVPLLNNQKVINL